MKELLTALQKVRHELPPLIKNTDAVTADGKNYKYLPLDQIISLVFPILEKNGFVCWWSGCDSNPHAVERVVCQLHHIESDADIRSAWTVQHPKNGNPTHEQSASRTVGMRRTLLDLLGVCPKGEDTDAGGARPAAAPQQGSGWAEKPNSRTTSQDPTQPASVDMRQRISEVSQPRYERVAVAAKASYEIATKLQATDKWQERMGVFNDAYAWEGAGSRRFFRKDGKSVTPEEADRLAEKLEELLKDLAELDTAATMFDGQVQP